MFNNLKNNISELAFSAVSMAEQTLSSSTGQEKKEAAIDYVVSMLPVASPIRAIVTFFLSKFIDEAIENAVNYMNGIKNKEV